MGCIFAKHIYSDIDFYYNIETDTIQKKIITEDWLTKKHIEKIIIISDKNNENFKRVKSHYFWNLEKSSEWCKHVTEVNKMYNEWYNSLSGQEKFHADMIQMSSIGNCKHPMYHKLWKQHEPTFDERNSYDFFLKNKEKYLDYHIKTS